MKKTVIIVPCYNEEKRLDPNAFLAAVAKDRDLSFLFVNDGSTDGTILVLESLKKANPSQIFFLNLEKNSGKAEAVRCGLRKAAESGCEIIGYWDADLATPLEEIENFCKVLDENDLDLVIGSRVKLLGKDIKRKVLRHFIGRVFATFASLLLRIPVYDTQCGAKVFRNTSSLRMVIGKPFMVDWIFDVELLARIIIVEKEKKNENFISGWYEYPVNRWADISGSRVKTGGFLKAGVECLKIFCCLYVPFLSGRYRKYIFN